MKIMICLRLSSESIQELCILIGLSLHHDCNGIQVNSSSSERKGNIGKILVAFIVTDLKNIMLDFSSRKDTMWHVQLYVSSFFTKFSKTQYQVWWLTVTSSLFGKGGQWTQSTGGRCFISPFVCSVNGYCPYIQCCHPILQLCTQSTGKVIDLKQGKNVIMIVTMSRGQWSSSLNICPVSALGIALPFSKLSGSAKWG